MTISEYTRGKYARRLRAIASLPDLNWPSLLRCLGASTRGDAVRMLSELVKPEERTCCIVPFPMREMFTGKKFILSVDVGDEAKNERFDRLAREIEKDAHFMCSNCHVLFGTREVANADYDILEDGTYEVSNVAPLIKFCPNCGAKVVRE